MRFLKNGHNFKNYLLIVSQKSKQYFFRDLSRFFELFGVFELEVLESSLGPSWPELEKAKPELEKAKSEPARAIFLE